MNPLPVPEAMRIGQARLTAGLDRFARIDLAAHRQLFGTIRRLPARQLIELAERADLRGRGGAAFPFARKLRAVLASAAARKSATVIVVNGTEGEPGSAKDAMLLIRSPYLVLGGALLACRALGAREIVVGVAVGAADGLVARSV
ncbi:MAG TPA: NADH-quinone oxidoreductase subunit I, partial [Streptosporangiaceae bacterium]|nr:NADH-quinone oxidoreductase subunit I [Streptosporangiaceae bacterium]